MTGPAPPSAEPASVCLSPVETWDRVLAGNGEVELARVDRFEPDAARIIRRWLQLGPGIVCRRLGTEEAPVRYFNEGALVMIRLQRRIDGDMACEYRLSDGAMVRQAAGSLHDSHLALGMTLLERMGRRDAAVPMARLTRRSGPPSLRWQALCECLGLDTVTGFALLTHIAGNGDDPLAPQAAALRAQLVETHPALAEMA